MFFSFDENNEIIDIVKEEDEEDEENEYHDEENAVDKKYEKYKAANPLEESNIQEHMSARDIFA
jgi:hypothetical protein